MPTLCPVAIAIGCRKCPVFTICPAKGLIGDQSPAAGVKPGKPANPANKPKPRRSR